MGGGGGEMGGGGGEMAGGGRGGEGRWQEGVGEGRWQVGEGRWQVGEGHNISLLALQVFNANHNHLSDEGIPASLFCGKELVTVVSHCLLTRSHAWLT